MPRKGQKHTPASRERMRLAKLGTVLSEAHRAAISAGVRAWLAQQRKDQGEPKAPDDGFSERVGAKSAEPSTAVVFGDTRQRVQQVSNDRPKPPPRYDRAA